MLVEARADLAPELLGTNLPLAEGMALHLARQVVEQRCQFRKEQVEVILDAGTGNAAGDVFIEWTFAHIHRERFAEGLAEAGYGVLVQRIFAPRQQADAIDLVAGDLGFR